MAKSGKLGSRQQLRPLFWWLLLVLVLFAIHTHQRLMEQTRLYFTVSMQGQPVDAAATFDGKPAVNGENIPLGNHTFVVTHPKGVTFSTNLFIWYGEHNLGTIDLIRAKGILVVTADPPASILSVSGPEWSVTLKNSAGLTTNIPTDQYRVESRYAHWESADEVAVFADSTATWRIAPRLGAAQLSCNQPNATFQLLTWNDQPVEAAEFPSLIKGLPEGSYKLISQHHYHQQNQTLVITTGVTNDHVVEFLYGAAVLESEPAGADVQDGSGGYLGVTPIRLSELLPGTLQVTLHRPGFEPVSALLGITANQTATLHTNLISTSYTSAMKIAGQYMYAEDYNRALQAVADALVAKPGDAEAIALQRKATGLGQLQDAKALARAGDYIGGGKELTLALQSLPDSGEITKLIADYKQHEPEQIERQKQQEAARIERERVARLNGPRKEFDRAQGNYQDAKLFDDHEFKTGKSAKEMVTALGNGLLSAQPPYVFQRDYWPTPDIHFMAATQKFSTGIMSGGERICLMVIGQTKDDECQILFKVLEYQRHHRLDMNVPITQLPVSEDLIPVSPSRIPDMTDKLKAQLQEGVSNVTAIIQSTIGQTPAARPTSAQ